MFDSSKLDAYLTGLCQARDLPGVSAAIMGPDGLEYAFNYGFRDGAFTRPVDNDTLFGVVLAIPLIVMVRSVLWSIRSAVIMMKPS